MIKFIFIGGETMSLRFIYGRAGYGKSRFCLEDIRKKLNKDDNHPLIIVVPEQFSFQAEKNLITSIYRDENLRAKVFSFRRMAYRAFTEVGGLTRQHMNMAGRAMLIYRIMNELKGDLRLYSKSAGASGFVDTISEIITELKRYDISPPELINAADIITDEVLKNKLSDIGHIFEKYESAIHEKYIDTEDDMTMLYEKIDKSHIFDDAEIYFDEFASFTPQQYKIIEKLMTLAKAVNITLTMDTNKGIVQNTDLFALTKATEERLIKIAGDNNISIEKYVDLNSNEDNRFRNSKELLHMEKHLYSFPYKEYREKMKDISIYKAMNIYTEVEEVARDISKLIRRKENPLRYRDIAIATRDVKRYESLVRAVFEAYNIPSFIDERREITGNPLIVFIISMLEIFSKNWSYESVFRYLKTGMLKLDKDEIDLIENYVLGAGIKGKKWLDESWEYRLNYDFNGGEIPENERETILRINEIKNRIVEPLNAFYMDFSRSKKSKDYCTKLFQFLENNSLFEKLEEYINTFKEKGDIDNANEYSQVWNVIIDVLDQIVEVMGEEEISLEEFSKILLIGFSQYTAGLIPPSIDQVTLGSVDRMRSHNVKALYILGVNDGVFPRAQSYEGVFNDKDRNTLKSMGLELADGTRAKAFEEQYVIYSALSSAGSYLRISYPMADHDGKTMRPSIIISRMKKLFPAIKEESSIVIENSDEEALGMIWAPLPTFNEMISVIRMDSDSDSNKDGTKFKPIWKDVYKWYLSKEEWKGKTNRILEGLKYTNVVEEIEKERARKIYGKDMQFSISRLEKYAECPFAYFIKYGLRVKDRKIYKASSPDIGTFMHNVLNEFAVTLQKEKLTWKDIDKRFCTEAVNIIVDNMVEKIPGNILNSSPRYKYLSERLKRTLITALWIISEHIKRSEFEPEGYEEGFGPYDKYPPIKIVLENGEEINLIGRIDRVDMMDTEIESFVRIIDYKSGNKDVKLTDIYYGLQLQLLTYLDAILEGAQQSDGNSLIPAGILYFKIDNPIIKGSAGISDEDIESEILKELKLRGLLLDDYEVIKSMDLNIEGNSEIIPASVKADGTLGSRSRVVTKQQFGILREYVKGTIKDLSSEMLDGNINIKPYKKKKEVPCTFCDYGAICQFDTSIKGNNYRIINEKSDDEIWSLMETRTGGGDNNE